MPHLHNEKEAVLCVLSCLGDLTSHYIHGYTRLCDKELKKQFRQDIAKMLDCIDRLTELAEANGYLMKLPTTKELLSSALHEAQALFS